MWASPDGYPAIAPAPDASEAPFGGRWVRTEVLPEYTHTFAPIDEGRQEEPLSRRARNATASNE
jgi:hypothetical protein